MPSQPRSIVARVRPFKAFKTKVFYVSLTIAVLKETALGEARVAATPDIVKKYIGMGADVQVQSGAGTLASFSDDAFTTAGATIVKDANAAAKGADVVLCVQRPDADT